MSSGILSRGDTSRREACQHGKRQFLPGGYSFFRCMHTDIEIVRSNAGQALQRDFAAALMA